MTTRRPAFEAPSEEPISPKPIEKPAEVLSRDVEILPAVEDQATVGEEENLEGEEQSRSRGEGAEDEDFDGQPSAPRRVLPDPGQPTARQVDEHRIDHWPYRSWCKHCVEGRCTGEHHRGVPEERKSPKLCFDYLFFTKNKRMALKRDLLENEEIDMKVIVAKEDVSKAIFAHAVEMKGADEDGYATTRLVEDVHWLGYT